MHVRELSVGAAGNVFCPAGISALLTVALEGARDPAQLQMVEFGRGFGYKLPLSIGMPSVGSNILKQIVSPEQNSPVQFYISAAQ